jgi:hypothetical protein
VGALWLSLGAGGRSASGGSGRIGDRDGARRRAGRLATGTLRVEHPALHGNLGKDPKRVA